jgi:hypothetical protein
MFSTGGRSPTKCSSKISDGGERESVEMIVGLTTEKMENEDLNLSSDN